MKFNWKTYFCSFFDEQKQIAAANLQPSMADARFVRQVKDRLDRGEVDLQEEMEMVAKKVQVKPENSFILMIRKPRQRIGLKLLKRLEHRTDERNDRYYQRDENRVDKRIRGRQFFSSFEEYSDSEDYVSEEDSEDSESTLGDSSEVRGGTETSVRSGTATKHRRQQSSLSDELHLMKRTRKE